MKAGKPHQSRQWLRAPLFSARGFIVRAMGLAGLYAICHLVGLREHTTFLSGTSASAGPGWNTSVILGATYITTYLGFVVIAPILLLAGVFLELGRLSSAALRRASARQELKKHGTV